MCVFVCVCRRERMEGRCTQKGSREREREREKIFEKKKSIAMEIYGGSKQGEYHSIHKHAEH